MLGRGSGEWKVRSALREATRTVHERLHQATPFAAIAREQLSLPDYTDLLARLAQFHFTVGQAVRLDEGRRELLALDLEQLGMAVPAPVSWSRPASAAARLGWAYAVEGSSLGGKVVYRQLDYLFGDSAVGRRFFRGCPSDAERWRVLCRRLEAEGRSESAINEMIAGASGAFALFERLIAPVPA